MENRKLTNAVMASDRQTGKWYLFDLDVLNEGDPLEKGEVFSLALGAPFGSVDMKCRKDTVLGDVLVVAGWKFAQIFSWPEGRSLWFTSDTANNPHAVEILPSGNLVVANSTGCCLRLYHTSVLGTEGEAASQRYEEYPLPEAHGLLYDPSLDLLWALGETELAAYRTVGSGAEERLVKDPEYSTPLPEGAGCGHDLSADLTDSGYLYLTANGGVFRFCKQTRTFDRDYPTAPLIDRFYMKGLSNNPQGNFFYTRSNGGKGTPWEKERFASWSTDRIHFCRRMPDGTFRLEEYVSEQAKIFYKCRAFCEKYL